MTRSQLNKKNRKKGNKKKKKKEKRKKKKERKKERQTDRKTESKKRNKEQEWLRLFQDCRKKCFELLLLPWLLWFLFIMVAVYWY